MSRYATFLLGLIALWLWGAQLQVPTMRLDTAGERYTLPSIAWITWLTFTAGVMALLAARKKARHPRRKRAIISGLLLFVGLLAFNRDAPVWMAWGNLGLGVAFSIVAMLSPKTRRPEFIEEPSTPIERMKKAA